jgi:hypothetical protein
MLQSPISPEPRQVPHLRLIQDEESVPYDGDPPTARRESFAVIPASVYDLKDGYALAVYAALAKHADREGVCWPSMKTISELTGWHVQTCRKAVKKLVESGVVAVESRQLHGMDQSNRYRLAGYENPANEQVVMRSPAVVTTSPLGGDEITSGWCSGHHELEPRELEPRELEGDTPLPPKQAEYPAEFETFWTHYPSGHGNKKKTAEAWKKIKPDPETRAQIMAGLEKWNCCDRWRRGYVKDAVVWLRDRWWLDEPPPPDQVPPTNGAYRNGKDIGLSTAELLGIATEPDEPANVFETFGRVK